MNGPNAMSKVPVAVLFAVLLAACGSPADEADADHAADVDAWRHDRLARLKAPYGYLNLVGLYWLDGEAATFGGDAGSDIRFPGVSGRLGTFEPADNGVYMSVADGADVQVDDLPVGRIFMPDDLSEEAVTARHGSLAWSVVNRQGKLGVRLWNLDNPRAAELPPIPFYDVDPAWRVTARLIRFDEPRVLNVGTVIEGLGWNPESPGVVEFEHGGATHSLEAYASGEQLFFVFADRTSGKETYPAGRFLYADLPGEDGRVLLDFNKSYNPPCAFNDFSTCPIASPRNRLPIAITAGEKFVPALYAGSG